jgi:hypothetical protein
MTCSAARTGRRSTPPGPTTAPPTIHGRFGILADGDVSRREVQSIRLGFLGMSPFRLGALFLRGLDFLGFPRPNRNLSMGCAGVSAEDFLRTLSWREKPERGRAVEADVLELLKLIAMYAKLSCVPVSSRNIKLVIGKTTYVAKTI